MRVGVHGRNDVQWPQRDLEVLLMAGVRTVKMMSHTSPDVFRAIRGLAPDMEFIVRLYDDRFGVGHHPTPGEFVARMGPVVQSLRPWVAMFEVHNEPNHPTGLEGWGTSDEDARSYNDWHLRVLQGLRVVDPWAEFGFPGLAVAHRDLPWLDICRAAVEASDWLGCHCYWQYENYTDPFWGQRYIRYHRLYPNKTIEVTELGDSTPNLDGDTMARRLVEWYRSAATRSYIGSASAFILSSPDPTWAPFAWRLEDGTVRPVVAAVGALTRELCRGG